MNFNQTFFDVIEEQNILKTTKTKPIVDANTKILFTDFGIKITDRSQYFQIVGQNKLLIVKSSNTLKLELSKSSSHE